MLNPITFPTGSSVILGPDWNMSLRRLLVKTRLGRGLQLHFIAIGTRARNWTHRGLSLSLSSPFHSSYPAVLSYPSAIHNRYSENPLTHPVFSGHPRTRTILNYLGGGGRCTPMLSPQIGPSCTGTEWLAPSRMPVVGPMNTTSAPPMLCPMEHLR